MIQVVARRESFESQSGDDSSPLPEIPLPTLSSPVIEHSFGGASDESPSVSVSGGESHVSNGLIASPSSLVDTLVVENGDMRCTTDILSSPRLTDLPDIGGSPVPRCSPEPTSGLGVLLQPTNASALGLDNPLPPLSASDSGGSVQPAATASSSESLQPFVTVSTSSTVGEEQSSEVSQTSSSASKLARGLMGWPEGQPLERGIQWKSKDPAGVRETWWPMAPWGLPGMGNRWHNLWARGGPCSKFDEFTGNKSQAYQYEHLRRTPLDIVDAIKHKIGVEGIDRIDGMNAGHCNQVAGCSSLFKTPTKPVTRENQLKKKSHFLGFFGGNTVEFSPRDIKGLMAICFDDLVKSQATDGQFGFTYEGFRYFDPPQDVPPETYNDPKHPMYRGWNDPNNPYPHRVIETVIKKWMVKEHRKIIAERKPGAELDNFCYDGCELRQVREQPENTDVELIPKGGTVRYYEISLLRQNVSNEDRKLKCWVHTSDEGEVSSNWIRSSPSGLFGGVLSSSLDETPTFYWVAHLKPDIAMGAPWTGFAESTNPEIDMFEVWKLYMDSTVGSQKRIELERDWPERIKAHRELVIQKREEQKRREAEAKEQ